jgi:hypothetical protein
MRSEHAAGVPQRPLFCGCADRGMRPDAAAKLHASSFGHAAFSREHAMRKLILLLTAATGLTIAGTMIGEHSLVAVVAPIGVQAAADEPAVMETVQFDWQGGRYCWHNGWQSPGWYWCGYHWGRGSDWGGPVGCTVGADRQFTFVVQEATVQEQTGQEAAAQEATAQEEIAPVGGGGNRIVRRDTRSLLPAVKPGVFRISDRQRGVELDRSLYLPIQHCDGC